MKRYILSALVAVVTLLFVACQSQTKNEMEVSSEVLADTPILTFSFAHPKGEPITYGDLFQDAQEWKIKNLWMYTFEADGADDYKLAVAPKDIKNDLQEDGHAKYKYTYKIDPKTMAKTQYHFLFVANAEKISSATVGAKKSDLMKELQASTQGADESSSKVLITSGSEQIIPMTGVARLDLGEGRNTPIIPMNIANTKAADKIRVDLIRTVARIDVYNTLEALYMTPGSTDLVVTGLKLKNAYNKAYLFSPEDMLKATDDREAIADVNHTTAGVMPFTTLPTGGLTPQTTEGSKKRNIPGLLEKAFYLHEGESHSSKDDAPTVEVTFSYRGKSDLTVDVPFFQGGKPVPVKRNTLYFIVLGDGNAPIPDPLLEQLTAYIAVKPLDWYEATQINHAIEPLKVTAPAGITTYNDNTQALTLEYNTQAPTEAFTIASNFANSTKTFAAKIKPNKQNKTPDWITVEAENGGFKITEIKANPYSVQRTAVIQVNDTVADKYIYEITVTQKANPNGIKPTFDALVTPRYNPLAYVAHYNVTSDKEWDKQHTIPSSFRDTQFLIK